jgi:hypothetical protein
MNTQIIYSDKFFPLQKPQTRKWMILGKKKLDNILPLLKNKNNISLNSRKEQTNPFSLNSSMTLRKSNSQKINVIKFKGIKFLSVGNSIDNKMKRYSSNNFFFRNPLTVYKNRINMEKIKIKKMNNIKNIVFNIKKKNLDNSFDDNGSFLTKRYYEKHKNENNLIMTKLNENEKRMKMIFNFKKHFSKKSF